MWKSASCKGERCFCGAEAAAKIGEEIARDDPVPMRHNLTAYVCEMHFRRIFGDRGVDLVEELRKIK